MGEYLKTFSYKSITMKLFAMLSVASASTASWVVDHWWGNANKVYNYVSANGDSFASVVDAAPDASFSPLFNLCDSGADGFDTDKNGALTGDEINAYYAEAVKI